MNRTLTLAALTAATGGLATSRALAERYDPIAEAFAPQACGGTGCWTNHLRVTDLDGDGDLDVVLVNYGDYFNGTNSGQPLVIYENDGAGGFTNVSPWSVGDMQSTARQVAMGDVNGDGAIDLYAPSGWGGPHTLLINDGSGVFADQADTRLPATYPHGAAARMGDVDNDGDLDLFVSDGYAVAGPPYGHLYINDGEGFFTESEGAIPAGGPGAPALTGKDVNDVEFADVDRDFDLDLVVNAHSGGVGAVWFNNGKGVFTVGATLPAPNGANYHYNVSACDVDGDGDLDLWIDNTGPGYTEQLLINDGQGNYTDETSARVTGNPGADDNGIVCFDIDQDGDLDGVVLSLATPERLLENDGAGHFTYVAKVFPAKTDCTLWGEFGDLNGDGRADLVTGQGECSSSDEVYFANTEVPIDTLAPVFPAIESLGPLAVGSSPTLRFAVQDETITDEGPRLSRAYVVLDPDGVAKELDATFMGGDLYRVVLPPLEAGTVQLRVCARDRNKNLGCVEGLSLTVGDVAEPPDGDDADVISGDVISGDVDDADVAGGDVISADVDDADVISADVDGADVISGDVISADVVSADVAFGDTIAPDVNDGDAAGGDAATDDTSAADVSTTADVAASTDTSPGGDDLSTRAPDADVTSADVTSADVGGVRASADGGCSTTGPTGRSGATGYEAAALLGALLVGALRRRGGSTLST